MPPTLSIRGASEHNLRDVDLELEHGQWICVVGPSGSGKTSLVFDSVVREGQQRFLSSLSPRARQYFGKLGRAKLRGVAGLRPAIAIGARALSPSARSTVGTISGVLPLLRLYFARVARDPGGVTLTRSHFSFNHPLGACEGCAGLGLEDSVDPNLLIADESLSLRAGALVPTLKNGYTVYSQVTLEVMNSICAAHGFDVDEPWCSLEEEQRAVILYGTRRLKVPFGKHAIESRMKWQGITARPREEGFYKGLVPVIEETLKRDRNSNILRFVRSVPCTQCGGSRLARPGRLAQISGRRLPSLLAMPVQELTDALESMPSSAVLEALRPELQARLERMGRLGLGHLALERESTTLSGGEAQRLRLTAQLGAGLCGVLFALDEPTLGLHPSAQDGLRAVLDELRELGNTLLVVEHDPDMVRQADWLVRLGPGAGPNGGQLLSSGPPTEDPLGPPPSPKNHRRAGTEVLTLRGATLHNLHGDDFELHMQAFNVVLGPSGAGKSSLIFGTLLPLLDGTRGGPYQALEGVPAKSVQALDARPIGRTSRSTPATWSGLFDLVRKRFAATPMARARKWGPGHFSYNNKHGRCPACEGLGTTRIGLHLFENVELTCESCAGGRYAPETLQVELHGKSIAEVLQLSVIEAARFFEDDTPIASLCDAMQELGLGHLCLGSPSNRLSRGESQRVKLATLLGKTNKKPTLLLLDEPDRGLHPDDLQRLTGAIDRLVDAGHTVLAISHHRHLWAAADFLTEVVEGRLEPHPTLDWQPLVEKRAPRKPAAPPTHIRLRGVRTNNLRDIDVNIPRGKLTVICGVSGSGKSSLAFGTLASEAWQRFAESLPFEVRRHVRRMPRAQLESAEGLAPTLSLQQGSALPGRRSTVATQSGLGPILRLLFARAGSLNGEACGLSAEHFSPDRALGACPTCSGRGCVARCDAGLLVTHPERSLPDGALGGTRPGAFFSDPHGQHMAILRCALGRDVDLSCAWRELPARVQQVALEGSGDKRFEVLWEFAANNKEGAGAHTFTSTWDGFLQLVEREAQKRAGHKTAAKWATTLAERACAGCSGSGLGDPARSVKLGEHTLPELFARPLRELLLCLSVSDPSRAAAAAHEALLPELQARLDDLLDLGLGALCVGRRTRDLSSGERQRVRLASVLRSGLTGLTIVLDEPTAGLQADQVDGLLARLHGLRDEGNTLVVVEHDLTLIRGADHLIELGPGAGAEGGRIVAQGAPAEVLRGDSSTAKALRATRSHSPVRKDAQRIRLHNVCAGPLSGLEFDLPRSGLVVLGGASGSGKSTLLYEVLEASFRSAQPVGCSSIELEGGFGHFAGVGSTRETRPASTLLSALDLMAALQKLYHAQAAGGELAPQAFSFRSPKGRCKTCGGSGRERVSMDFMADLQLACPACKGQRYRPEVLRVHWDGLDPAQFLALPVHELGARLSAGRLRAGCEALVQVGMGYLSLGRRIDSLSGGEAQRTALARCLLARPAPRLLLFDNLTAGLHMADVALLLKAIEQLTARGDLVIATGRQPMLVAAAHETVQL